MFSTPKFSSPKNDSGLQYIALQAQRPPDPEMSYLIRTHQQLGLDSNPAEISTSGLTEVSVARVSAMRDGLPRSYGWIRTSQGRAQRVIMLWDTGATHTIISPRIARSLGLQVSSSEGPTVLSMADDHQQECLGKVDNIQLLVGNFRTRLSVLVAETGNDDVIIGNDILEARRGGLCNT